MIAKLITQKRLRELLHYDPETGIFTWKISPRPRTKVGDIAGSIDRGYIRISIGGQRYDAQNLAWFYIYGEWTLLDHEDRDKQNNTIKNLRKATWSQNNANRTAYNELGVKGVYKDGKGFCAKLGGKYLGYFKTIEEASKVYKDAAKEAYGEFACE